MENKFSLDSIKNKKYFYRPLIIILLFDILGFVFIIFYKKMDLQTSMIVFLGIILFSLVFYLIPLMLLFTNHTKNNKDFQLSIIENDENNIFKFTNKNDRITFSESDVKKIVLHLTPPVYDDRTRWFFWDDYFYTKIITNENELKISCLLCDDFSKYISKEKIIKEKTFFPLL